MKPTPCQVIFGVFHLVQTINCNIIDITSARLSGPWNASGAALPRPRFAHAVTMDQSRGLLYMFGGAYWDSPLYMYQMNDLWRYSLRDNRWSLLAGNSTGVDVLGLYGSGAGKPQVPGARMYHKMHFDPVTSCIYMFFGYGFASTSEFGGLADLWSFNTNTLNWTYLSGPKTTKYKIVSTNSPWSTPFLDSAISVADRLIYIVGQTGDYYAQDFAKLKLYVYNITVNSWTAQLLPTPPGSVYNYNNMFSAIGHQIVLRSNKIYLVGGQDYFKNTLLETILILDLKTLSWSFIPNFASPRQYHSVVYNSERDTMYMFGGQGPKNDTLFNDLWMFTFAKNQWTRLKDFPEIDKRYYHAGVLSAAPFQDRLYIISGSDLSVALEDIWSIDITYEGLANPTVSPSSTMLVPAVLAGVSAAFLVIICVLLYLCKKRKKLLVKAKGTRPLVASSLQSSLMNDDENTIAIHSVLAVPGHAQYELGVDYAFQKLVTEGGFSEIFLASLKNAELVQRAQADIAIVKLFKYTGQRMAGRELDLFLQEVAIANRFSSYPQFVQLLGYDFKNSSIIMKYYRDGSLHDFIRYNRCSPRAIIGFMADISTGLSLMHQKDFVHCDIKTLNIIVDYSVIKKRYCAMITDFGLARSTSNENQQVRALQPVNLPGGTIQFSSPEIILSVNQKVVIGHASVLKAADVYSMAMVLYELVTRRSAWQ